MLQSMGWQRVGHDLATEKQQIADSLHCTAKTQHYEANTSPQKIKVLKHKISVLSHLSFYLTRSPPTHPPGKQRARHDEQVSSPL